MNRQDSITSSEIVDSKI